jgi:hypothetical protein
MNKKQSAPPYESELDMHQSAPSCRVALELHVEIGETLTALKTKGHEVPARLTQKMNIASRTDPLRYAIRHKPDADA